MRRLFFPIAVLLFVFCVSFAAELPGLQAADANDVTAGMVGDWTCVGFVENPDDFSPDSPVPAEQLFLKILRLEEDGAAVWVFGEECSITTEWDGKAIVSVLNRPAVYQLKSTDDQPYLFVEWIGSDVTALNRPPCWYVCKKADTQAESSPVGRWMVVDFVETVEQFDPNRRNINTPPMLRGMAFLKNGMVWWIYENNKRRQAKWGSDAVDDEPGHPAHFIIKQIDGKDYLFIEWISGDVTVRGQKPRYYVLKKAG